jgi:hypothetical protein
MCPRGAGRTNGDTGEAPGLSVPPGTLSGNPYPIQEAYPVCIITFKLKEVWVKMLQRTDPLEQNL